MTETKRVLFVLQHTQSEFLGQIEDHLEGRGIGFQYIRPFVSGGKVPGTAALTDGLILLGGGAWGTVSEPLLPSLSDEIRLTKDFLNRKRPVVGIGLGAQILCLAAGGTVAAADLAFEVGEARRVRDDALAGYLPERFPFAVYMRDRPVLPEEAEVLAADAAGRPAVFGLRGNCLGFIGHPGAKPGMFEDLLMETDDGPADPGPALERLRTVQRRLEDALVPIMTGMMAVTGLMRPLTEAELARRRPTPMLRR